MSDGLDPILQQKEQQQLKTQLLWRLGIAATLIAVVLGAIAWFDQARKNGSPRVQITQIAPEASAISTVTASIIASATPVAASNSAEATPTPVSSSTPTASPTATPTTSPTKTIAVAAAPNQTEVQSIGNAPQPKPSKAVAPVITSKPSTPLPAEAIVATPSKSALSLTPPMNNKPALITTPLTQARPNQPATAPTLALTPNAPRDYPAPTVGKQGYSVQAGVFLLSNNAEKLLSQLQQAGIPAYLETRVQIGPFKNKADADAAVKKLRQLGIEPVVKSE